MDQNKVLIGIVLDRSGSMKKSAAEAIGGFNRVVEDQKKSPGTTLLTLAQFDDEYELIHDALDVQKVEALTDKTYVPRGWTALLDAMGRTIVSIGEKLAALPEEQRPAKVTIVTITDGEENASKEYTHAQIKDMIKQQENIYSWEFVFLGSEPKAVADAIHLLGYDPMKSFRYDSSPVGTRDALNSVSRGLLRTKAAVAAGASDTSYKHGG